MNRRILLVDDDPNILQGYRRQLRKQFQIEIAPGGKEGLECVTKDEPFAVIVSDMQMPQMDGIQFLTAAREIAPNSVRMMLTGNADQKTATNAVNDGHIFRFLTKPCSPEELTKALEAGIQQHRLITAEHELLSKTLSGSVSVLTEVLALVNPMAFGRASSVRRLARQMCQELRVGNAWEIEIAALLSQIGCVTISESTLEKLFSGTELSAEELRAYQGHPRVGHDLIAKIPRLKGVAKIIVYQQKCFDGSGVPADDIKGDQIPLGSRVLKLVLDVVQLISTDLSRETTLGIIQDRQGWYDPRLMTAIATVLNADYITSMVMVDGLEEGMILDEHVVSKHGDILLACGQDVTVSVRERLKKFSETIKGVREPIRVRRPIRKHEVKEQ